MSSILIRDAVMDDMPAIQAIYAHHVLHGIASFEETPPDLAEITRRMEAVQADGYPFRVAELDGAVRGYAYANSYRPRPAYRHCVENSIYIDRDFAGMGFGAALLDDLISQCTDMGFRQMIAVIGDSENWPSIKLHARFGFLKTGVQKSVGFKHGRWIDQVLMQLSLGEGDTTPP